MARTTPVLVKSIIDVAVSEPLTLDPYIDTANQIVTTKCLPSQTTNPDVYTDARLELIERWLAAHFFAVNRRRSAAEGVSGAVNQTLDPVPTDLHLNSTHYGQTAIALDTDGNLAAYNNALDVVIGPLPASKAGIRWLGKRSRHYGCY